MADDQAMTIRLPAALYEQLRQLAFLRRVPMNRIVVLALERQLEQEQK